MLRSITDIIDAELHGTDGRVGHIQDLYVDDRTWHVRYFIADTGGWLSDRDVLLAPACVQTAAGDEVHMDLTKKQIEDSPELPKGQAPSREHEQRLAGHYAWPPYWGPMAVTSSAAVNMPGGVRHPTRPAANQPAPDRPREFEHRLRTTEYLEGMHLCAADGRIGHVQDLLVDPESWIVRYLVVDTRNWLPGRTVLLPVDAVEGIDEATEELVVRPDQQTIKASPKYHEGEPVDRDYEQQLQDHYGLRPYWADEPA